MKTILITSQKGGSGKTTLAAHLSVEAERLGDAPVYLIDTDKQATLSLWHDRREAETPQRLDIPISKISNGLKVLADHGAAYCFIDTAPTISDQNTALIALADFVLVPVRPSPADLWAVAETVAEVKKLNKHFMFSITQAKSQASITAQTVAALSQHGRVAQSFIGDRVPYAAAMTSGQTAPELDSKSPAAKEITALWSELKICFNENSK
jgi:chromosome partitioning protein